MFAWKMAVIQCVECVCVKKHQSAGVENCLTPSAAAAAAAQNTFEISDIQHNNEFTIRSREL